MNQHHIFLLTDQGFGIQNIQSCKRGNKQCKLLKEIELTFE